MWLLSIAAAAPLCQLESHASPRGQEWDPQPDELAAVISLVEHRQHQREDLEPYALRSDTSGYAELHTHPLSDRGFGLRIVSPGPPPCEGRAHGIDPSMMNLILKIAPEMVKDNVIADMLPHCMANDMPSFDGWTHEQFSLPDMRHAHDLGMDLMVMYAVNNSVLCALNQDITGQTRESCSDRPNVDRQLAAAWAWEHEPGVSDWLSVVVDPLDAAKARAKGKLAVVLGIEASNYFDLPVRGGIFGADRYLERKAGRSGACDPSRDILVHTFADEEPATLAPWRTSECGLATASLGHVQRMGVTAVYPVHEWNTMLGGAAFQHIPIFQPGYSLVGIQGIPEHLGAVALFSQFFYFLQHVRSIRDWPMSGEIARDGGPMGTDTEFPRNLTGVTPMGRAFVQAAYARGMILDLAHYGERGVHEIVELARALKAREGDGPMLLFGHVTSRSVTVDTIDNYEFLMGDATLRFLASRYPGRVILGLRTALDPSRPLTSPDGKSLVENCMMWDDAEPSAGAKGCARLGGRRIIAPGDSRSLWQAHAYLRTFGLPFGLGADMNGGASQSGPRRCLDHRLHTHLYDPLATLTLDERATRDRIEAGDPRPLLVTCPELTEPDAAVSPYVAGGLRGVVAEPHLLADLHCLEGQLDEADPDAPDCVLARRDTKRDKTGQTETVCGTTLGLGDPICHSAANFIDLWRGETIENTEFKPNEPAPHSIARTWAAPTSDGPSAPSAAGSSRGSGSSLTVIVPGSGSEWLMVDRVAERNQLRKLRFPGLIGDSCETLDEHNERAAAKKEAHP